MIEFLVAGLVLLALAQPIISSFDRLIPAFFYAGMSAAHCFSCWYFEVSGALYYFSAMIASLFVIAMLSALADVTEFTLNLIVIAMAAIIVNFIGWVLYMAYSDGYIYQVLGFELYAFTLYTMLKKDKANGNTTVDSGNIRVSGNHR